MTEHTTAHEDAGPGRLSAGRILVVPGLDGHPRLLMAAAPRLFPGLRALPFDHGRDPAEGGVEGLAARALRVLDADPAGDAAAYVAGESFGGTIALTLARSHPERVRGLVLFSTFGWYPGVSAYASRLGMACWRLLGDRLAAPIFGLWRPVGVPGALGRRPPRALTRAYLARPRLHLPGYRAKSASALAFDARPWLGEIACPTLILIGTRDPVVPTHAGRELARRLPNARLHCLPGGHLVHIVRAAEAGALIARWMADLNRGAPAQAARSPAVSAAPVQRTVVGD
jgi:pimeloyl-ACP methyl ester carboxylesterase